MGTHRACVAFCVAALLMTACHAHARAERFTRVARTDTPIPGGTGNFTSFDPLPNIGHTFMAFRGFGAGGQEGIYTMTVGGSGGGVLQRVADRNSAAPTGGTFATLDAPTMGHSRVFRASTATHTGIYRIADGNTFVVDASDAGASYSRGASSGPYVAFRRDGVVFSNRTGFLNNEEFNVGSITPNMGVGVPDVTEHDTASNLVATVAVRGDFLRSTPRSGVFFRSGNDTTQLLFETAAGQLSEVSVGFRASVAAIDESAGVKVRHPFWNYWPDDTAVRLGDAIPSGTGGFTRFTAVAAGSPWPGSNDTMAVFVGEGGAGQQGLYVLGRGFGTIQPRLLPLVTRGQTLDGRVVDTLSLSREGEFNFDVVFHATFTDGSSGIYLADLRGIPEPTSAALLCACTAGVMLKRRHRLPARSSDGRGA